STCAWLSTTASMSCGGKGNSELCRRVSGRLPKVRPQSSNSLKSPISTRCIEPVTIWVAPQKVTLTGDCRSCVKLLITSLYHLEQEVRRPLTTETQRAQRRQTKNEKNGKHLSFLIVFSVLSVSLWLTA